MRRHLEATGRVWKVAMLGAFVLAFVGTAAISPATSFERIPERGVETLAKNEVTSRKAASNAAKVLRDPKASKAAKSAAGSALTQRPGKKSR